jgi:thiamine-monophosphate kinase
VAAGTGVALRRIGRIEAAPGLRLLDARGCELTLALRGFDHFNA